MPLGTRAGDAADVEAAAAGVETCRSVLQVGEQLDKFSQMQMLLGQWELLGAHERHVSGAPTLSVHPNRK